MVEVREGRVEGNLRGTADIERNPNATMPIHNLRALRVGGWDRRRTSRERGTGLW